MVPPTALRQVFLSLSAFRVHDGIRSLAERYSRDVSARQSLQLSDGDKQVFPRTAPAVSQNEPRQVSSVFVLPPFFRGGDSFHPRVEACYSLAYYLSLMIGKYRLISHYICYHKFGIMSSVGSVTELSF